MSASPLLSINIPTYNRLAYLKEALAALLPQVSEEVEINVADNHSTDGTWEYLGSLEGKVNRSRPVEPNEPNHNILSCVTLGKGAYTWIHCDDDIAKLNAAENILRAIREFGDPPALTFQWAGVDAASPDFVNSAVTANWKRCDRNEFLREISYQFTFASAIIIRRGCADLDYITSHAPLHLIPGNIILSVVGKYNEVIISEEALLTARGNPSNAERLSIFSREIWQLFRMNKDLGYDRAVIKKMYDESLKTVLVYSAAEFRVTWRGAWDVAICSFTYKAFYTAILPILVRKLLPKPVLSTLSVVSRWMSVVLRGLRRIHRKVNQWSGGPLAAGS